MELNMAKKNKKENLVEQQFSFTAPGAMSVLLAGDFTHWQANPIPMKNNPMEPGKPQ